MKVDSESIRHVLALFDPEDIPYIKRDKLLKGLVGDNEQKISAENTEGIVKVKKIGDYNDRFRK